MEKICKNENCSKIVIGRIDRVFCSSYCKSDFHATENKKSGKTIFKFKIDSVLKKNRAILAKYNIKSKATVRKEVLLEEGFNPRIFTHYWKNVKGDTYLFCYDQGFKEVKDNSRNKYLLVLWQDGMEKQVFGQKVTNSV
ncbi:MAG: hypothetical protein AB8B74_14250 [Crocinitomicaceae bacterium]